MYMNIFDLPPRERRVASRNIFQAGNIYKKYLSEPDYYICYRAGYWSRWLSIFFAVVIFSIIYAHHNFGFFPDIMSRSGSKNYLELYVYLINFTGYIFIILVAYYFYIFFKIINFKEYNFFREIMPPDSGLGMWPKTVFRNLSIICLVVSFILMIFPGRPTVFFYKAQFHGYYEQYFNDIWFMFIVSIMLSIIQGYTAVATISCTLFALYSQYEIRNNR